jgi:hypothetical protein
MWHVCRRKACMVFVGKAEGKRPVERLRRKWEDNIKMYEFLSKKTYGVGLDSPNSEGGDVAGCCE